MKRVVVLGLGVSGKAAANYLTKNGYAVIGVDEKVGDVNSLTPEMLQGVDFAIASPGIPPAVPWFRRLEEAGIEVVGEAEFFLRPARQTVIGVTGTNGKTTVTLLMTHVLQMAGKKARAVGNVGLAFGEYFLKPDPEEILVAELSSYQLYRMESRVLDGGVVLNLSDNHLDWHGSMEAYAAAKLRMGACLKEGGLFLLHESIPHRFSDLVQGNRYSLYGGNRETVASNSFLEYRRLPKYEWENLRAAWLCLAPFGVTEEQFCRAYATFKRPLHRLESLGLIEGVHYFNDSKGTTCDAVVVAVEAMQGPTYLIAGGLAKGCTFAPWRSRFGKHLKKIFAIGEAASQIEREVGEVFDVEVVHTLQRAVERAKRCAQPGESILLSPGCASFDQFKSYVDRGEQFRELVKGEAK